MKYTKLLIKEYFFQNPTAKLRVREIERVLDASLPSVIRYCKELLEEDFLVVEQIGSVTFYTPTRNEFFCREKQLSNLRKIYMSGLIGYLKREWSNPGIVLFGSFAKGEDIEGSDIDLYIQTPSKRKIDLKAYEKNFQRDIQIFKFRSIKDINPHLANNIINGITLNDIEVF